MSRENVEPVPRIAMRRLAAVGGGIRVAAVGRARRWVASWMVALAAVLALALPSTAEAHTLTPAQARHSMLGFARGVAYSYDTSQDPFVRCTRSGGSAHTVYCDWGFVRRDAPLRPEMSRCTGRYRVYLVGATQPRGAYRGAASRPQRAVARRLSCARV